MTHPTKEESWEKEFDKFVPQPEWGTYQALYETQEPKTIMGMNVLKDNYEYLVSQREKLKAFIKQVISEREERLLKQQKEALEEQYHDALKSLRQRLEAIKPFYYVNIPNKGEIETWAKKDVLDLLDSNK